MKIFRDNPSDLNYYALMGAMTSLFDPDKIRNREKNFEIKDENFLRIKKFSELKEFEFIVNEETEEINILTKNMFGKDE